MKAVLLLALLVLAGCAKEAESTARVGADFAVDKLFTNEGCTAFRFSDGGRFIYYVDCNNQTTASWTESCGKSCTRRVSIPTIRGDQ